MILDTFREVFVWFGYETDDEDKMRILNIAMEYLDQFPSGRDLCATSIIQVKIYQAQIRS